MSVSMTRRRVDSTSRSVVDGLDMIHSLIKCKRLIEQGRRACEKATQRSEPGSSDCMSDSPSPPASGGNRENPTPLTPQLKAKPHCASAALRPRVPQG